MLFHNDFKKILNMVIVIRFYDSDYSEYFRNAAEKYKERVNNVVEYWEHLGNNDKIKEAYDFFININNIQILFTNYIIGERIKIINDKIVTTEQFENIKRYVGYILNQKNIYILTEDEFYHMIDNLEYCENLVIYANKDFEFEII